MPELLLLAKPSTLAQLLVSKLTATANVEARKNREQGVYKNEDNVWLPKRDEALQGTQLEREGVKKFVHEA